MSLLKKVCFSFVATLMVVLSGMVLYTIYVQTYLDIPFLKERLFDSLTLLNFIVFWLCVYIGIETDDERKQQNKRFQEMLEKMKRDG